MPEHCEAIDANVLAMAEGLRADEALEGAKVTKTLCVSEMTLASVISADSGRVRSKSAQIAKTPGTTWGSRSGAEGI